MRFLAVLMLTIAPLVAPQFLNPSQKRELWRIGETRKVQYNTKLKNYTIALWQQAVAGGSAELGPILVETTDGPKKDFVWQVDPEKLDLGASNIFFFWLFEGDKSVQGQVSKQGASFSSAFFNITDEAAPESPPRIMISTAKIATSTSVETSTEQSPVVQPTSSTAASTSTSTTTDRTTPAATEPEPTDKTKAEDGSSSNTPSVSVESGQLSVGAQAGIGIGVGLVGVSCIVCVVLWYRYLKRRMQVIAELQGSPFLPQKSCGYSRNRGTGEQTGESLVDLPGYYVNRKPVEID